jgi:hypothetical protein
MTSEENKLVIISKEVETKNVSKDSQQPGDAIIKDVVVSLTSRLDAASE